MHLPLDIFLALRYLRPKRTFVSIISLLSVLGPLLGVAILIIVTSVMAGFDHNIRKGIMNMQAHLTFYPKSHLGYFPNPEPFMKLLEKYEPQEKLICAPVIEGTALLQLKGTVFPKVIRGISPQRESKVTRIQQNFSVPGLVLQEGQAALGASLGSEMGLAIGDEFLIHSPSRLTQNIHWQKDGKIKVEEPDEFYLPEQCQVASYYSMGISDYDDNIVVMHLDQAADLFGIPWGSATSIQAVVDNPMELNQFAHRLRARFGYYCEIVTWQEKNQLLFNTLQSEKNLMTFLMAFIVLVASFAISATLITVVVQKTREIGIMKAVGVSSFTIARIFLLQGAIIGVTGTTLGTIAGLLILHYRDAIARLLSMIMGVEVFPAELYHLTSIPALTTPGDLCRIVIMSMVICIGAALIPGVYASCFSPAQSLHAEE